MSRILVATAAGKCGAATMHSLIEKGADVRGAMHHPNNAASVGLEGREVVKFDYNDPDTWGPAFDGVDAVFLAPLPGESNHMETLGKVIDFATEHARKIVLMTVFGADTLPEDNPFRALELRVEQSGVDHVFLRPNWFMQNFNSTYVQTIIDERTLYLPAGDAKVSFIDVRDIGDSAAAALTQDDFNGRGFQLTGPEALDHHEVAEKLTAVIGEEVKYVSLTPEEFGRALRENGIPESQVQTYQWLFDSMRRGEVAPLMDGVKQLTGREPRDFDSYARDYVDVWRKG